MKDTTDWTPFNNHLEFETTEFLFKRAKMSAANIDILCTVWAASLDEFGVPTHPLLVTVTCIVQSMQYLLVVFHGKVQPSPMTALDLSHVMVSKSRNGWRTNMKYGLGTRDYSSRTCWQIAISILPSTMHHFGNTTTMVIANMKT